MIVRIALLAALASTSAAPAQLVYEPVRIEYGDAQPYYYAGDDRAIHAAAAFPSAPGTSWGRVGGFAFANDRRRVTQRFARTFTDAFGSVDARPFGLTINDVANEANARVPRFFRKADLLASARDGIVSPTATAPTPRGTIDVRPYGRPPLYPRRPLLVLPRALLDRPLIEVRPSRRA